MSHILLSDVQPTQVSLDALSAPQQKLVSVIVGQVQLEEDLTSQVDDLRANVNDFQSKHGGFVALWDKIKGGPNLQPFLDQAADIQKQLDASGLEPLVKKRIQSRLDNVRKLIVPGDWIALAGLAAGTVVVSWALAKAGAMAGEHAKAHVKRYRERRSAS